MSTQRKIIHIDMDAFFASVEQRDNPDYHHKPLIVGGQPNSRGVVAACSYEARKFGIHSAMSCAKAYSLCPEAIFVPPRFEAYREVSKRINAIFWRYASQVEPLSLDEAYLDVSYTADYGGSATRIAEAIKRDILTETGLITSAGISYNKFLAKIASDMDKPDGLYVILPQHGEIFIAQLPIEKFHGIGPATAKKMHALGIQTGADLYLWSETDLITQFGKAGLYYYQVARGIDHRTVKSSRQRKSLGKETTFAQDIMNIEDINQHAETLAKEVLASMATKDLKAKTITLKMKYADFTQITRSSTQAGPITSDWVMQELLPKLLAQTEAGKRPVRLIGISISSFILSTSSNDQQKISHSQMALPF